MMSVVAFASKRPIAVFMLALVISALGVLSWNRLPLDLLPQVSQPIILVSIRSGDRPAEHMERWYGERIERRLFTLSGIQSIDQTARSGTLIARLTLERDANVDLMLVDVNRALATFSADPLVDELRIRRFDTQQSPIISLGVTSKPGGPDLSELRSIADRHIATHLERLDGVAEVRTSGGRIKEVQIHIDATRLKSYGITISEVSARVLANNVDFNAGTLEDESRVLLVRGESRFVNPQDIANVVVRYQPTQDNSVSAVRVRDIATVKETYAELTNLVRVNGQEGIGLFIYKSGDANTVSVSRTVRAAIDDLARTIANIDIELVTDDATLIEDSIKDVKTAAIFGTGLAIGVLVLFLRSVGPVFIVALAVPVSLLATALAMDLSDKSINIITLGGLTLGIGLLVDNAIVVIESIHRRRALGDSVFDATLNGVSAVGGAITTSTLTTCIVFMPVLFIDGLAAKLVSGISFTVVVSLLASLLVALLLIPALFVSLLSKPVSQEGSTQQDRFEQFSYRHLGHPFTNLFVGLALVVVSIVALMRLGTELIPPVDPTIINLRVVTPVGQRIESTEQTVEQIEEIVRTVADNNVLAILSEVGRQDDNDRVVREEYTGENTAELRIRLARGSQSATNIMNQVSTVVDQLWGVSAQWKTDSSPLARNLGSTEETIIVELQGQSLTELRRGSEEIKNLLSQSDLVWNVRSSFDEVSEEIQLLLDRKFADRIGVDFSVLQPVLSAALDGLTITDLSNGDETRDVVITMPATSSDDILNLEFRAPNGQLLTIGDVARLKTEVGAQSIMRRNQRRVARISATASSDYNRPYVREQMIKLVDSALLPGGVTAALAGNEAEREATTTELKWTAVLALVLVLMVLAGSFESFAQPLVVLSAVPFALIGVACTMVPQAEPLGVMAALGFIVLVGIAVNDAILLAKTADALVDEGLNCRRALARASSLRLRPIIMTTTTTVLALLPLALSSGDTSNLRSPLAWTVVGGLIASTLACLLVIPSIYLLLNRTSGETNLPSPSRQQ